MTMVRAPVPLVSPALLPAEAGADLKEELAAELALGKEAAKRDTEAHLGLQVEGWSAMALLDKCNLANTHARSPNPRLLQHSFSLYLRLLEEIREDSGIQARYPNLTAQILFRYAVAHFWHRDYPACSRLLRMLLELDPHHPKGLALASLINQPLDFSEGIIDSPLRPGDSPTPLLSNPLSRKRNVSSTTSYHQI